jgi:DNA-binding response OmpR family regulator
MDGRMERSPRTSPTNALAGRVALVADDDADLRALVRGLLERRGCRVVEASDGDEAVRRVWSERPDIVVLDVAMPRVDGWEVLARLRGTGAVPVIMLTRHTGELERVRGLRGGADDYVAKPFSPAELTARVEAVLRRSGGSDVPDPVYADDLLRVDRAQARVHVAGDPVALTPVEFRLLCALVEEPGRLLSRDDLLERVWGAGSGVGPGQVKLYVGYLRRKLGLGADGGAIETVRGFGYRYRAPGAEPPPPG